MVDNGLRLRLNIHGTPGQIMDALARIVPNPERFVLRAQQNTVMNGHQILFYQAAALAILAQQYNRPDARILEVGTGMGFSATIMAQAARLALVTTLNPRQEEYERALRYLKPSRNVRAVLASSANYYDHHAADQFDLVFVDGSHALADVLLDLRWFDCLRDGGLICFHDYSPLGAGVPAPGAHEAVERLRRHLGRALDVLVVDDRQIGFAGVYRQPGERFLS